MSPRRYINRSVLFAAVLVALLLAAVPAGAAPADAAPSGATGSAAATEVTAAAALPSFRLSAEGAYRYHGRRYVLPGTKLSIRGNVNAELAGEQVNVEVYRGERRLGRKSVTLKRSGGRSVFRFTWKAGKKGNYRLRVDLTESQAALAEAGSSLRIKSVRASIHSGSRGIAVRLFQSKLRRLHYVVPLNGRFDAATGRALMAFRKVTGMARNYTAGETLARKLAAGKGRFHLRRPGAGRHVEVSIRRQVMVFAEKGRVVRIYHVSTGAPATPTVRGTYNVYMKDGGTNAKGMVKSSYFIRGYAIHGYASVPPYNASHGCVRVPVPNAASIFRWVHMGTRVDTYY
jgi:hypothetical protein